MLLKSLLAFQLPGGVLCIRRWASANPVATAMSAIDSLDTLARCQMDFNSGAGGTEAMLFTGELMQMYKAFVERHQWSWKPIQVDNVGAGAVRSGVVIVEGPKCFSHLRFEAGVHRVQRNPITDKSRIHTSTASVAVLPEMENPQVELNQSELKIEAMKSAGAGGMNVNARNTAIRITHLPSGIAVKAMDERHQHKNLEIAYRRLGAILLQQKLDKVYSQFSSARKIQVGSQARAEKIRTYNFKEQRVTDHRLKHSITQLQDFLAGGKSLDEMVGLLQLAYMDDLCKAGDRPTLAKDKHSREKGGKRGKRQREGEWE